MSVYRGQVAEEALPVGERVRAGGFRVWRRLLRFVRRKPLGAFGLSLTVLLLVLALGANVFQVRNPLAPDYPERLQRPSLTHWFGTDGFGRDVYSRVLHALRTSLGVSFGALALGGVGGGLLGLISGYKLGRLDILIQRGVDVLMAFPTLVLALALVAAFEPSVPIVIGAIAVVLLPRVSRIVRGSAISLREEQFVDAARALGAQDLRIVGRHLLPNALSPWLVIVTAELGNAIIIESSLSYLGLGVQEPHPSLGTMLSANVSHFMRLAPWLVIIPGIALSLAVFGLNIFGDALRDILDPRLRQR
ncbi:MAG: ABC transporter permease [Dehalococcoidia bacterium]